MQRWKKIGWRRRLKQRRRQRRQQRRRAQVCAAGYDHSCTPHCQLWAAQLTKWQASILHMASTNKTGECAAMDVMLLAVSVQGGRKDNLATL
jgi:hypothetical protein